MRATLDTFHAIHRARFAAALGPDAALLFAAPRRTRSADTDHRYRQDSSFWWLTGWSWPGAALLLRPALEPASILFVPARDPTREVWTGPRPGLEEARDRVGVDAAFPADELESRLPDLLRGVPRLHARMGEEPARDARIWAALHAARRLSDRAGQVGPDAVADLAATLEPLRVVKSDAEIARIRASCDVTVEAFLAAMGAVTTCRTEWALQAVVEGVFLRHGASAPAFPTIVAAGDHATTLHYEENRGPIRAGDLVLVDAGCELEGYASDVTRTLPASGAFTGAGRHVYEAVLAARAAALAAVRPGARLSTVHDAAVRSLAGGLVDLGLATGDLEAVVESGDVRRWFPHRIGHWLGVDVHDVGRSGPAAPPLEPGMVLTIEPGLYLPASAGDLPEALRGLGVRIEDDVLVTADGAEVLTAALPVTVEDVEAAVRAGAPATGRGGRRSRRR